MIGHLSNPIRHARHSTVAALAVAIASMLALSVLPARAARGPDAIADVAEKVIDAVVNISTSQKVDVRGAMPQLPPGSPFEEFFEEFFKKNGRGGGAPDE